MNSTRITGWTFGRIEPLQNSEIGEVRPEKRHFLCCHPWESDIITPDYYDAENFVVTIIFHDVFWHIFGEEQNFRTPSANVRRNLFSNKILIYQRFWKVGTHISKKPPLKLHCDFLQEFNFGWTFHFEKYNIFHRKFLFHMVVTKNFFDLNKTSL